MNFIESPRFPDRISAGAVGGPEWSTTVTEVTSGNEQRDALWQYPRHSWDVSHGLRGTAQFAELRAFFMVARGRARGWRFKDWADYTATHAEGRLQPCRSDGVLLATAGGPTSRLFKRYLIGSEYADRKILKPVSGAVELRNGAAVLTPITAYALDITTGMVTWVATASRTVSSITVGSFTQLVLSSAISGLAAGDRLYLDGLTGADAAVLNGQSWPIIGVAGATYNLDAISTGKTITAGSGTAETYPGGLVADALTWAGEFDVPMRFDTDQLKASIEANVPGEGFMHRWESIPIVERNP